MVNDRYGPATIPNERERVVTVCVSHRFWQWNFQWSICVLGRELYVGSLFPFLGSFSQRF